MVALCLLFLLQDQEAEIRAMMRDPAEKVDVSLKETDVQQVLRLFAEWTGLNLMIEPTVKGTALLEWHGVPVADAFFGFLRQHGLAARIEGPLVVVGVKREAAPVEPPVEAPAEPVVLTLRVEHANLTNVLEVLRPFLAAEDVVSTDAVSGTLVIRTMPARARAIAEIVAQLDVPGPEVSKEGIRVFRLEHVDVGEIEPIVRPFLSKPPAEGAAGDVMLTIDRTQNKILVRDRVENVMYIERVLKELDVEPLQVMVEAALVQVQLDDLSNLGVNVQWLSSQGGSPDRILQTQGLATIPPILDLTTPPATATPLGFFATVVSGEIAGLLEALAAFTKFTLLAHPRVQALNNKRARIQIGDRLGYLQSITTQTSTIQQVQFLEVGTILEFEPHITENGEIRMTINPKVSSGSIDELGLPTESTSEIRTSVLVRDGQTLILGGLIREEVRTIESGVPWLKDVPLLGKLFQRKTEESVQSEVIVMMTPRIVRRGGASGAAPAPRPARPAGRAEVLPHDGTRSLAPLMRPRPYDVEP